MVRNKIERVLKMENDIEVFCLNECFYRATVGEKLIFNKTDRSFP